MYNLIISTILLLIHLSFVQIDEIYKINKMKDNSRIKLPF